MTEHSLDNWRDKHLATEIFRQATGVMSEEGSVQIAHDRPSKETPGRMAENCNHFSDGNFSLDNWRDK